MGPYLQYFRERFPIPQTLLLSTFVATAAGVGTQVRISGRVMSIASILASVAAFFLVLLVIRILDDFRDARFDDRYHPERPLQRGVLHLADLKKPLIVSVVLCLMIAFWGGTTSMVLFCLSAAWLLLAYKDYFSNWLRDRFGLYMFALEMQMIPILLFLYSLNGMRYGSGDLYFVALTFFIISLVGCIEVGRKIRAPERETPAIDTPISTYTAQYGILGASITLGVLAFLSLCGYVIAMPAGISIIGALLAAVPTTILAFALVFFSNRPTPRAEKRVFTAASVFVASLIVIFVMSVTGIV